MSIACTCGKIVEPDNPTDSLVEFCSECQNDVAAFMPFRDIKPTVQGAKVTIGVRFTLRNGHRETVRVDYLSSRPDGKISERAFRRLRDKLAERVKDWEARHAIKGYKVRGYRNRED